MPTIRLHRFTLAYEGVTWSANPHLVYTIDGATPNPGETISVGGETVALTRIESGADGIVDCYLADDLAVAIPDNGELVLPPFDQAKLDARVLELEAAGWTRSYEPHVLTRDS